MRNELDELVTRLGWAFVIFAVGYFTLHVIAYIAR